MVLSPNCVPKIRHCLRGRVFMMSLNQDTRGRVLFRETKPTRSTDSTKQVGETIPAAASMLFTEPALQLGQGWTRLMIHRPAVSEHWHSHGPVPVPACSSCGGNSWNGNEEPVSCGPPDVSVWHTQQSWPLVFGRTNRTWVPTSGGPQIPCLWAWIWTISEETTVRTLSCIFAREESNLSGY